MTCRACCLLHLVALLRCCSMLLASCSSWTRPGLHLLERFDRPRRCFFTVQLALRKARHVYSHGVSPLGSHERLDKGQSVNPIFIFQSMPHVQSSSCLWCQPSDASHMNAQQRWWTCSSVQSAALLLRRVRKESPCKPTTPCVMSIRYVMQSQNPRGATPFNHVSDPGHPGKLSQPLTLAWQ